MRRVIYFVIGILALVVAIIGIFLPVIPTTPLIMLSCFALSKSSKRFHYYLINSQLYHNYAKDFIENKTMPRRRKMTLLIFASTMLLVPLLILSLPLKLVIISVYLYLYYYFIFKIKSI